MHLLKFCIDPFPARCFWCSAVVNTEVTLLVTICSHLGPGNETISFPASALPLSSGMKSGKDIAIILAISTRASHFTWLFILFIYLFINFVKRPGSLLEQTPLRGPEKRKEQKTKIRDTNTNKNDNTLETTKNKFCCTPLNSYDVKVKIDCFRIPHLRGECKVAAR